jgi:hypothetical protein
VTDQSGPQPFNEQDALAELERLAERIQLSRRQRERAVEEFDSFVRTFRSPGGRPVSVAVAGHQSVIDSFPADAASAPPVSASPPTVDSWRPAFENLPPAVDRPEAATWLVAPPARRWNPLVLGIGGLVVLAAVILLPRSWSTPPPARPPTAVQPAPASKEVAPPVSTQPAPAAPARALNIELTIIRPVWVRAVVDDRRAVERQLNTGEKVPLGADRSIVIRAGDAGAIRLTVAGRDQGTLGRDGQILTRAFTVPSR